MNLFCLYHIEHFFLQHDPKRVRIDLSLKNYFKKNRALGSKDRKVIGNFVFKTTRFLPLLEYVLKIQKIDSTTIPLIDAFKPEAFLNQDSIPPHIRYGFNEMFFSFLEKEMEKKDFTLFLESLNNEAPLYLRSNPLKTTRDDLLSELKKTFSVKPTISSPYGIVFAKRENFSAIDAFKQGLMEVQDEASQLVAMNLEAKPKERVLDFCAGSGGKSLLIGALMENQGQLFLHDARLKPLIEAKKRCKRAGIQNYQILLPDADLQKFSQFFDRVLLDVPCSGTGTLRRNPDMKGRLEVAGIHELIELQRKIFAKAFQLVKPGGYILWATCSVLKEENQNQIEHFCEHYPVERIKDPFQTIPAIDGPDGFFCQLLQRKK